jgi:Zn-finger nucleic acid-binding protein
MEIPMRCPVDNETLVMADRNGVEIDYCPKCRGVWLDRGELDKIIDRATGTPDPVARSTTREAAPVFQPEPQRSHREEAPRRRDHDDDDDYNRSYKKKRRESFLGDLFDF